MSGRRLSDEQLEEIKLRASNGENKTSLAAEFGVAEGTIKYHTDPNTRRNKLAAEKRRNDRRKEAIRVVEGNSSIERAMSAKEVAKKTGINVNTLYSLARKNEIGHIRPGPGRVMFRQSDVDDYLARIETRPRAQAPAQPLPAVIEVSAPTPEVVVNDNGNSHHRDRTEIIALRRTIRPDGTIIEIEMYA